MKTLIPRSFPFDLQEFRKCYVLNHLKDYFKNEEQKSAVGMFSGLLLKEYSVYLVIILKS